jgi:hypothetical protein
MTATTPSTATEKEHEMNDDTTTANEMWRCVTDHHAYFATLGGGVRIYRGRSLSEGAELIATAPQRYGNAGNYVVTLTDGTVVGDTNWLRSVVAIAAAGLEGREAIGTAGAPDSFNDQHAADADAPDDYYAAVEALDAYQAATGDPMSSPDDEWAEHVGDADAVRGDA